MRFIGQVETPNMEYSGHVPANPVTKGTMPISFNQCSTPVP